MVFQLLLSLAVCVRSIWACPICPMTPQTGIGRDAVLTPDFFPQFLRILENQARQPPEETTNCGREHREADDATQDDYDCYADRPVEDMLVADGCRCPVKPSLNVRTKVSKRHPRSPIKDMERVRGIEPPYSAWEAAALPLSYTRMPFHLNARPFDGKLRTDTNINAKGLRRDAEDPFSRGAVCGDKERPRDLPQE